MQGTDEDVLAWLEGQLAPAELAGERKAFNTMVQRLMVQQAGVAGARANKGRRRR